MDEYSSDCKKNTLSQIFPHEWEDSKSLMARDWDDQAWRALPVNAEAKVQQDQAGFYNFILKSRLIKFNIH